MLFWTDIDKGVWHLNTGCVAKLWELSSLKVESFCNLHSIQLPKRKLVRSWSNTELVAADEPYLISHENSSELVQLPIVKIYQA
jgi:hypothetical protein